MLTTIKRINVGSAFRVGVILYGLLMAVFGLFFVGVQALLLNGLSSLATVNSPYSGSSNVNFFTTAGLVGLCIFYGLLVVFGAIFGGIQFAVIAFFYNLTANWVGGVKVELEMGDSELLDDIERDTYKPKRGDL